MNEQDKILESIERLLSAQQEAEAPEFSNSQAGTESNNAEQEFEIDPDAISKAEMQSESQDVKLESIENMMIDMSEILSDIRDILSDIS